MITRIPFSILSNNMITVPVTLNDEQHKFIFDTGIGITLISKRTADSLKLKTDGVFYGKRMSGQEVPITLSTISSLEVGFIKKKEVIAGIFDMSGFPHEFDDISGILSPGFFKDIVFTVNNQNKEILLGDGNTKMVEHGTFSVPIEVVEDGPSVSIFIELILLSGRRVKVEVDTGSDSLILNSRYMDELNIAKEEPKTKKFKGTDETGNGFIRYFSTINGSISIADAEEINVLNPKVIFQDIIYDGLIGTDFLKRYNVTYDLHNRTIGFSSFKA